MTQSSKSPGAWSTLAVIMTTLCCRLAAVAFLTALQYAAVAGSSSLQATYRDMGPTRCARCLG